MAEILNKLYQPVTVNLSDGSSVIFLARETKNIPLSLLQSTELQNHIKKKHFMILKLNDKEEI